MSSNDAASDGKLSVGEETIRRALPLGPNQLPGDGLELFREWVNLEIGVWGRAEKWVSPAGVSQRGEYSLLVTANEESSDSIGVRMVLGTPYSRSGHMSCGKRGTGVGESRTARKHSGDCRRRRLAARVEFFVLDGPKVSEFPFTVRPKYLYFFYICQIDKQTRFSSAAPGGVR